MAVERIVAGASFADVLERVLGKGVVVEMAEGSARLSLLGVELMGLDWHVTGASLETRPSRAVRIVSVTKPGTERQTDEPGSRALPPPTRSPRRQRTPRRKDTA